MTFNKWYRNGYPFIAESEDVFERLKAAWNAAWQAATEAAQNNKEAAWISPLFRPQDADAEVERHFDEVEWPDELPWKGPAFFYWFEKGWQAATEAEREACAKVCDEDVKYWMEQLKESKHDGKHILTWKLDTAESLADAIRARSTKGTE